MKRTLLLLTLSLVGSLNLLAQNTANLIIFTQDPMPFYAIVNGIRQNTTPQTNLKVTGLSNNTNSVKIVFSDGKTPDIDKNFYFEKMNVEVTARIVNTKKGYKLRYFGEVAMGQAVVDEQQVQIVYQTVEAPMTNNTSVVTEETVTTTTTTTGVNEAGSTVIINDDVHGTNENVNMNVNVAGVELNMNVNVNDNGMNTNNDIHMSENVETTYTTTTTTTTTTSGGVDVATGTEVIEPVVYVAGYTGRIGCPGPISNINSIKSAIEDEDFSDDKIMVAKQALRGKCLTTDNVTSIMDLFDFEDKKLEFAKYAHDYTYDVDNYYKINKAFDFSSSKEELNEYIMNK